jgi:transcriptional regulator with PAS, ATPase and Fis domain
MSDIFIALKSIVDTYEEPFVVIDKKYCIRGFNKAFEETFHADPEMMVGKKCYEVTLLKDLPCSLDNETCPYVNAFKLSMPSTCRHTNNTPDGQVHKLSIKGYPLLGADNETYLGMLVQSYAEKHVGDGLQHEHLVGRSPEFHEFIEKLDLAASSVAPVLLFGETGTGKGLAASQIHTLSDRKAHPFVTIDCTVLSETLFESEMFGHEPGAYTGSVGRKEGLVELAHNGTLFLDEISEMPTAMQAKLLRLIETGEFRRVGGKKTLKTNVRIISATNRDLLERMEQRFFRKDLFYRIAVLTIRTPALREHRSDIPLIVNEILFRMGKHANRTFRITPAAIDCLMNYDYPGNVRELRNILQLAATYSKNGTIDITEIGKYTQLGSVNGQSLCVLPESDSGAPPSSTRKLMQDTEAKYIIDALAANRGNRSDAARALGLSERTLYRKLKQYGIG